MSHAADHKFIFSLYIALCIVLNCAMADEVIIEPLTEPMALGEGPHWIEKDNSLVFVDFPSKCVNRYYTDSKRLQILDIENAGEDGPSFIIPISDSDDLFSIGLGLHIGVVQWRPSDPDRTSKNVTRFGNFEMELTTNRLNDGKVDPQGRLWTGTAGFENATYTDMRKGNFYRVDSNFSTTAWATEVSISNGMAWNANRDTFYYIDSPIQTIYAFDYDDESGELENQRVLLNLKDAGLEDHYPDGMAIDNLGNLWVACYNGAKIINVDPNTEKIIRVIPTPSKYTTSCCFGGPNYSTLFVTTATRNLSEEELVAMPDSGKTLAITGLGVRGFAPQSFKADLELIAEEMKSA